MVPASFLRPSGSCSATRTWLCAENPPRRGRALSSLLAPAEHAAAQLLGERLLAHEEPQHRAPEGFGKKPLGHRRQRHQPPIGQERPVGGKDVHVRVEVRQIPEGLHEQDQPGPGARCRLGIRSDEHAGGDPAKLTQPRPMPAEDGAQEPRDGEHALAMRCRREHLRLHPFAVKQHSLSGGSSRRSTGSCTSTRADSRARRRRSGCGRRRDAGRRIR